MSPKPLATFKTKSGKKIEIWSASISRLQEILVFVNHLTEEDTFLSFTGRPKTLSEEENWLKNEIEQMRLGQSFVAWAIFENRIIGSVDIHRGTIRDFHVGRIGLMVDRDFRREGIGRKLLEYILKKGEAMGIKIATISVFSDNKIAISLYQQFGFKEWGRLPHGLYRQGRYSDEVKMYKEL